jgi:NitT/TauT family transport system substrate-binding protein
VQQSRWDAIRETMMRRRNAMKMAGSAAAMLAAPAIARAAMPKIVFGTDWLAEAEQGGFYQAMARGFYAKHGLDVSIRMGGPSMNALQNIAAGLIDFQLSSGSFGVLNLRARDIPVTAIAAYFQKDPQCLIAHPGERRDTLAEMKGQPIMISAAARTGYWLFLKAKYGFTDEQIRPYNFSLAPFLADPKAVVQGFVTSEAYQVERITHQKPVVILLADAGYSSYGNLVLARQETLDKQPGMVRAFVEACTEGWYDYLYGDPEPGNRLIVAANPDMKPDTMAGAIRLMKQYGIADSADSLTLGIGAMTDARWQDFFASNVAVGVYDKALDYKRGYTLDFVDKGYGLAMRPK